MDNEDRIRDWLDKRYRTVVEAQIEAAETLEGKRACFDDNRKAVHASLKRRLKDIEHALAALDKKTRERKEAIRNKTKEKRQALDTKRKEHTEKHRTTIKELEASSEQKRSLNTLKEEKIEHDHSTALSKVEPHCEEQCAMLDQRLEEAESTFSDNMAQLGQDTDLKKETLERRYADVVHDVEEKDERRKALLEKEMKAIADKIERYEKTFAGTLKETHARLKERLSPHEEALSAFKQEQKRDIEEINAYYEGELTKLEKYRKEKEKINDLEAAAALAKDIKKTKKKHEETLAMKRAQHDERRPPLEKAYEKALAEAQRKAFAVKSEGLGKIADYVNGLLYAKSKDLIETNDANIDILKHQDRKEADLKALDIDDRIQRKNYDRTLEEAKLEHASRSVLIRLDADLEKEREIKRYRLEKNRLVKSRSYAKALHRKETEKATLDHRLALDTFDVEKAMISREHTYELDVAHIENNIEKVRKDHEKESVLIDHYDLHAQNYTALKNDSHAVSQSGFAAEHKTRKQLMTAVYKNLLDDAERDHATMVEDIEKTYKEEIVIYEQAYRAIEKEHQTSMQSLMEKQALERNKDLEHIESLDPKKNKRLIRQYRQNLAAKQADHDAALALKKRELDNKRNIYQSMIDRIKHFRMQSLEEADTLLMHLRDQFNQVLIDIDRFLETEKRHAETMLEKTAHSAGLFETFQRKRHEQTKQLSETYLSRRIEREKEMKVGLYQSLNAEIARHKDHIAALEENAGKHLEDVDATFRETCATIEKTEIETVRAIEEETGDEIRRIEQRIQREKKRHEAAMKTLASNTEKAIASLYTEKDDVAAALEQRHAARDEDADAAREKYEKEKQEDLSRLSTRKQRLTKWLKEDAFRRFDVDDARRLKAVLQGVEPLEKIIR